MSTSSSSSRSHRVVHIVNFSPGLTKRIGQNELELKSPGYIPPLDQVTTCSDDSSSVSSMSSVDEYASTSSPISPQRSIFSSYWEKTGDLSAKRSRNHSSAFLSETEKGDTNDIFAANSYERSLNVHNNSIRVVDQSQVFNKMVSLPRRNILGLASKSHQDFSLSDLSLHHTPVRKIVSASKLERSSKRSCLRKGRFSKSTCGGTLTSSKTLNANLKISPQHTEDCSVSFNDDVNVIVYQRPVEHWAADGWSNIFV